MTFIDEKTCEEVYETQANQLTYEEGYAPEYFHFEEPEEEQEELEWTQMDEIYHLFGPNWEQELYW